MIKQWFSSRKNKAADTGVGAVEVEPESGSTGNNQSARSKASESDQSKTDGTPARPAKEQSLRRKKAPAKSKPWDISQFTVEPEEGKTRFHDLSLPFPLMRAIADLQFQYCSPIQAQILPHTLQGHDAIGKAQTGTGKTAAFLITIINDLLNNSIEDERYTGEPRALIIAPTRELVMQIGKDALGLCKYAGLNVETLIGGMDYQKQKKRVEDRVVDIVVATPGRLLDFCSRKDLHLDLVELLVIDEADRMLDMGFIPQVRRVIAATPQKTHRQTLLFSATFTDDVLRLARQWTYEPISVEIEPKHVATDSVDQRLYHVSGSDKVRLLKNILSSDEVESAIIFANRRDQTRKLQEKLQRAGIKCGLLSGEVAQNRRTRTLEDFRSGKFKVLVATDVAGRGIHVDGISHVINYTLPEDPEDYVHRIGRTGRAGLTGVSISFVDEDDAFNLPGITDLLGSEIKCVPPPDELLS